MNARTHFSSFGPVHQRAAGDQGVVLQRKCACGGTPGPTGECEACSKKRKAATLQRYASHSAVVDSVPPIVHDVLQSSGRPLDPATRAVMEPRFGHDFSQVRLHTDTKAAESARAVNALAYTVGCDVVFRDGQYAPHTKAGSHLLAHELIHVVQQHYTPGQVQRQSLMIEGHSAAEREAERGAASVTAGHHFRVSGRAPRAAMQRQPDSLTHSSPASTAIANVNSEKWSTNAEVAYRRAGLTREANAVRSCREEGACRMLLTEAEAWKMYAEGRNAAGLEPPQRAGGAPLVAGALVAPALQGGGTASSAAAQSALARASVAWGTEVALLEGGAGAATAVEGATGVAASGATAGTVSIAAPVAIGIVVVVAIASLVGWASFQAELARQGFRILPNPLGVCIGSCHQPSRPLTNPFPDFPPSPLRGPGRGRLSPDEMDMLRRWIEGQGPRGSGQTTQPQPESRPQPQPQPRPRSRADECQRTHPYALICTESADLEEVVMTFLLDQGIDFADIIDIQCQGVGSFTAGAIDACFGAPGERWHCRVTIKDRGNTRSGEVSVFGCLCCHEDGTTGLEWQGAHWSVNLSRRTGR